MSLTSFDEAASMEIDRRIIASEQRIKAWVLTGIVTNVFALVLAMTPVVFYLGQITTTIENLTERK